MVFGALALLVALALGLPTVTLVYWVLHGGSTGFPVASLLSAAGTSLELGLGAALLTTLLALPVSILTIRHPSRLATALERAAYLPYALPGIVVALALIVVSVHHCPSSTAAPPCCSSPTRSSRCRSRSSPRAPRSPRRRPCTRRSRDRSAAGRCARCCA